MTLCSARFELLLGEVRNQSEQSQKAFHLFDNALHQLNKQTELLSSILAQQGVLIAALADESEDFDRSDTLTLDLSGRPINYG